MKKTFFMLSVVLVSAMTILSSSCGKDPAVDCTQYNSTYDSNMKSIIFAKCVTCHKVGGSAEGFGVYSTYLDMKDTGFQKAWDEIEAGRMPQSGSPKLTDAEKEAWQCWKESGFPEK